MKKDFKIAISGRSGCGNTTVSKMVSDTLKLRFINFTFRSLAQERDMDFTEILALAAKDDFWDREVDTRQVQIAREKGGCVLGSRLAIWLLKEADLKIYLDAKAQTRAKRIALREGGDYKEIAVFTAERDRQDHERYLHLYGIDTDYHAFVDMVIDTDDLTPQEITDMIVNKAKSMGEKK